jgi:hypothetical protein
VQAKADALAAEGRIDEAEQALLAFAREHPGTWVADRATVAARTLAAVATDRVDEHLRVAEAAAAAKDWKAALEAASRAVSASAPGEARERARKALDRIRSLVPSTVPGGTAPPSPGGAGPAPERPPDTARKPDPPREKPPAEPTGKDAEAGRLFRASREALEAGRLGEAERGFYRLLAEYADAKIVRDYGIEVQQRLEEALKRGRGIAGLFHGGLQFQGKRVALSWNFDDDDDLADWETIHPFAVPQKGTFKPEGGELVAAGAAALMTRACFRTESVSMSFRMKGGTPVRDVGAMMAEPKDLMNFLLFVVGNDYFRTGKGSAAQPLPGNVIWVFGKGMWSSTDTGMLGFVKTAVSEEPRVVPRKWTEIEVAKEGKKAKFVLDGRAITGASIGDNKYEITGVRPALFVLLSDAVFDEVTIEGDLDPEWVRAERERLFPALR